MTVRADCLNRIATGSPTSSLPALGFDEFHRNGRLPLQPHARPAAGLGDERDARGLESVADGGAAGRHAMRVISFAAARGEFVSRPETAVRYVAPVSTEHREAPRREADREGMSDVAFLEAPVARVLEGDIGRMILRNPELARAPAAAAFVVGAPAKTAA